MGRDTNDAFPSPDATPSELRKELLRIAGEIRRFGIGNQPDRIERIVELLQPPRLRGVLAQIAHPQHWLTQDGAIALGEKLTDAAAIIEDLLPAAEITGDDRPIARAREWLDDLEAARKKDG